jgi:hypothetical protein
MNNIISGTRYGPLVAGCLFMSKDINTAVHFSSVQMVVGTLRGISVCGYMSRMKYTLLPLRLQQSIHKSWRDNAVWRRRSVAAHLKMSLISYSSRTDCHNRNFSLTLSIFKLNFNKFFHTSQKSWFGIKNTEQLIMFRDVVIFVLRITRNT